MGPSLKPLQRPSSTKPGKPEIEESEQKHDTSQSDDEPPHAPITFYDSDYMDDSDYMTIWTPTKNVEKSEDETEVTSSQNEGDESFQTVSSLDPQSEKYEQSDGNPRPASTMENVSDKTENSKTFHDAAQIPRSQNDEDTSSSTSPEQPNMHNIEENKNANATEELSNVPISSVSPINKADSVLLHTTHTTGKPGSSIIKEESEDRTATNKKTKTPHVVKTETGQGAPSSSIGSLPPKDGKLSTSREVSKEDVPSSMQDFAAEVLIKLDTVQESVNNMWVSLEEKMGHMEDRMGRMEQSVDNIKKAL